MTESDIRERRPGAEPLEIRQADDGSVSVVGYVAIYGDRAEIGDLFTEEYGRGCFHDSIERGDDCRMLAEHEGLPLARTSSGTLTLTEDERGVRVETELRADDPDVKRLIPKLERGDLSQMSAGFLLREANWDHSVDPPHRTIVRADLYDVSIVTYPAYEGTEVALRDALQAHKEHLAWQLRRGRGDEWIPAVLANLRFRIRQLDMAARAAGIDTAEKRD